MPQAGVGMGIADHAVVIWEFFSEISNQSTDLHAPDTILDPLGYLG